MLISLIKSNLSRGIVHPLPKLSSSSFSIAMCVYSMCILLFDVKRISALLFNLENFDRTIQNTTYIYSWCMGHILFTTAATTTGVNGGGGGGKLLNYNVHSLNKGKHRCAMVIINQCYTINLTVTIWGWFFERQHNL